MNTTNEPLQVHFSGPDIAMIHLACRHERNAMRHIAKTKRITIGERTEAGVNAKRLENILAACEAVVPGLKLGGSE